MEVAVVVLSLTVLVLSIIVGVLAGSVPFLWWQRGKDRKDLDDMDEVVSELLKLSGLGENTKPRQ